MQLPTASQVRTTLGQVNAMLLRPFRQRVSLPDLIAVLILLLVAAGMWHLVLERVDVTIGDVVEDV